MADIDTAIEIAARAHRGQQDRNGEPYILHPLRVMSRVETRNEQIVAMLHDVVEDSQTTLEDLRAAGFAEEIVRAVDALTRREGESYLDLVRKADGDSLAQAVKLADLADHVDLDHVHFTDENAEKDTQRIRRYVRASLFLNGRISEEEYLRGASEDEKAPKTSG